MNAISYMLEAESRSPMLRTGITGTKIVKLTDGRTRSVVLWDIRFVMFPCWRERSYLTPEQSRRYARILKAKRRQHLEVNS